MQLDDRTAVMIVAGIVAFFFLAPVAQRKRENAVRTQRGVEQASFTKQGAKDALQETREWAKWMSGIQTAALAALAVFMTNADAGTPRGGTTPAGALSACEQGLALATLACLAAALLCSSWVLSALGYIVQHLEEGEERECVKAYETRLADWAQERGRGHADGGASTAVHKPPPLHPYDLFKHPLYSWAPIRLGELLALQHWYWAAGLISFGGFLWLRFT
jgi:hypothetical protein